MFTSLTDRINKNWIVYSFCIISSVIALAINSRAFFVGYIISSAFLIILKNRFDKKIIIITATTCIIIATLISSLYKGNSSLGRLLIYKISLSVFRDNYISGVGLGKFNKVYMLYQADYFKSGLFTTKEMLLAGNIYCAYNDYFQFAIETGIFGVAAIIAYFGIIIRLFYLLVLYKLHNQIMVVVAMTQFIALSVAACFTFIFDQPICQIIIFISLAIMLIALALHSPIAKNNHFKYACSGLVICALPFYTYHFFRQHLTSKVLANAKEFSDAGYKNEALSILYPLYAQQKNNCEYLHQLGMAFYGRRDYKAALNIFRQESEVESNNTIYRMLGQCYYEAKDYKNAEISFLTAVNMVPIRFTEKFELYKFYKQTNQLQKAAQIKEAILTLPVKIPSLEIEAIKNKLINDKLN